MSSLGDIELGDIELGGEESSFQPIVDIVAQSSMSVGSILINRYFGTDIVAVSSTSVFLTIERFLLPQVNATSTIVVHLTGGAESQDLVLGIISLSQCSIQLSSEANAQMSWTGDSAMFVRATVPEVQLAQMSWRGDGHLSVMAGFTPTGASAVQVIHIAESDGGTWIAGHTIYNTSALAYNITAAALQTALEGLTGIGAGNIAVVGGPAGVRPLIASFIGALANTPVGLLTADDSGLTGPVGLNPHVAIRSLSPGYSADDDYGTLNDISVKVENELGLWNFTGITIGLKVTESDNGGDETATWSAEFTPPYSIPKINSRVTISDLRNPWWGGVLENPKYTIKNGYMHVEFSARGNFTYFHDLPYHERRVFVDGTPTSTIFKSVRDELTQGNISITNDWIADGRNIVGESPDMYNRYPADIIDDYTALGDIDDSPLTYGTRLPRQAGYSPEVPILYVEPEATTPSLVVRLSDGAEIDTEIDSGEIVNRHYVPWALPDDVLDRHGQAIIDYSTVDIFTDPVRLRAQIVSQSFPSDAEATAYGNVLSTRHGQYRTAGGTILIRGGVPVFTLTGHVFPHWRIRPNLVFDIPDMPTPEEGVPPMDCRGTKFSWDQHTDNVTIITGRLRDLKRAYRQLIKSPNQRNQQPNEPHSRVVESVTDKSNKIKPWQGNTPADTDPAKPEKAVVDIEAVPTAVRTVTIHFVIPNTDTDMPCQIDFNCILRGVTIYGPLGQDGSVSMVIGHSTYASYGTIVNLTNLSASGNPGKARDMGVNQQLSAGDVVYAALSVPMTGYTHVIVALTCERSW